MLFFEELSSVCALPAHTCSSWPAAMHFLPSTLRNKRTPIREGPADTYDVHLARAAPLARCRQRQPLVPAARQPRGSELQLLVDRQCACCVGEREVPWSPGRLPGSQVSFRKWFELGGERSPAGTPDRYVYGGLCESSGSSRVVSLVSTSQSDWTVLSLGDICVACVDVPIRPA